MLNRIISCLKDRCTMLSIIIKNLIDKNKQNNSIMFDFSLFFSLFNKINKNFILFINKKKNYDKFKKKFNYLMKNFFNFLFKQR